MIRRRKRLEVRERETHPERLTAAVYRGLVESAEVNAGVPRDAADPEPTVVDRLLRLLVLEQRREIALREIADIDSAGTELASPGS